MAGADKTYINKAQYKLVKEWWLKTRKKQIKELGEEIYMYPFSDLIHQTWDNGFDAKPIVHYDYDPSESDLDEENMGEYSPVWNTSTKQNFWIAKNCPLDFIQKQITQKISVEFYQEIPNDLKTLWLIDKMTFDTPDCLFKIEGKHIDLYLYKTSSNGDMIFPTKYLVYGTTYLYKIMHHFKRIRYNDNTQFPYKVYFTYCGLKMSFCKGKMYYYDIESKKQHRIHIPCLNLEALSVPKFIYSWDKKDCAKYSKDEIILSFENRILNMSCYKDSAIISKERILISLNEYIYENLKN